MANKIFSVVTLTTILPSVRKEAEAVVGAALNKDWYMRTNALLGEHYVGHKNHSSRKLLYVPLDNVIGKVVPTVPEPNVEQIEWANSVLKQVKLKETPVNRSIVFALYGYNSDHSSSFVISTHPYLTDVILKKLLKFKEIPVLDMTSKGYQFKLKELLK